MGFQWEGGHFSVATQLGAQTKTNAQFLADPIKFNNFVCTYFSRKKVDSPCGREREPAADVCRLDLAVEPEVAAVGGRVLDRLLLAPLPRRLPDPNAQHGGGRHHRHEYEQAPPVMIGE